jgi:hypothetical protein
VTVTHVRIEVTEAQPGDEILQAGEWCEIASVDFMRHSSNVRIGFAGGGSHSFPVEHRPAVRRPVPEEAPTMPGTNVSAPATVYGPCDGCFGTHPACYDHEGRFNEGPIWAVPCPADGKTTFVTVDALVTK